MTKEVGTRIREIITGGVRDVMRDLDLFHLPSIDRVRTEVARDRRHIPFPYSAERPARGRVGLAIRKI
jgi:hypothetical protein